MERQNEFKPKIIRTTELENLLLDREREHERLTKEKTTLEKTKNDQDRIFGNLSKDKDFAKKV
jgi:hypothetical protein